MPLRAFFVWSLGKATQEFPIPTGCLNALAGIFCLVTSEGEWHSDRINRERAAESLNALAGIFCLVTAL
jgi:hypothetical protein